MLEAVSGLVYIRLFLCLFKKPFDIAKGFYLYLFTSFYTKQAGIPLKVYQLYLFLIQES